MNKKEMLESVKTYISLYGKSNEKILKAMNKVDRKNFVIQHEMAYIDTSLSIGEKQTISQPSTVARMLQLLNLKKGESVLEIGAGSGWNACLIAYLVNPKKVLSLERHKKLLEFAKKNVKKAGIKNLEIKNQDFRKLKKKFDKIIFTAGIDFKEKQKILNFAKTNLKDKGILVCPFQIGPLIIIKKSKKDLRESYTSEEYAFVPLVL